jgi:hypothetical protein
VGCSAGGDASSGGFPGGSGAGGGGSTICDLCVSNRYTPCDGDGAPGKPIDCPESCAPGFGCVACVPDARVCVGNDVYVCASDGTKLDGRVETCDVDQGEICLHGSCSDACRIADDQPSNVGCEFWAVDLDQQDKGNDPASAPWGVVLSNAGEGKAEITIELNDAPVGETPIPQVVEQVTVEANSLAKIVLPTRELDCGTKPNDYASPGTCLSSRAFRITSTNPIVVYQFNVFTNTFSNDASLLLPTNALGKIYRVIGWPAGHPVKLGAIKILDRSYVTIVGVSSGTEVTVKPSWRIKGNPPIAATAAGGEITVNLGPFDVLNLETDDGKLQDDQATIADLSGTLVQANKPVAVFSGVESAGAPGSVIDVPAPPSGGGNCCLDHLEEQMFPAESVGTDYVVTRSPIRSTGSYHEPDILRFVGVAEDATVTTNLPPPFDSFTLAPGEVKTTWTQTDVVVSATKPVMVGQILVSNQYVDGPPIGDPSLTVYPPVEQFRTEHIILTPPSWNQNWIVLAAQVGSNVTIDGNPTTDCITAPAGVVKGVVYEARRCAVGVGVHHVTGDEPFGIIAYGYGSAGSYAFAGGADVKRVYDPPIVK